MIAPDFCKNINKYKYSLTVMCLEKNALTVGVIGCLIN